MKMICSIAAWNMIAGQMPQLEMSLCSHLPLLQYRFQGVHQDAPVNQKLVTIVSQHMWPCHLALHSMLFGSEGFAGDCLQDALQIVPIRRLLLFEAATNSGGVHTEQLSGCAAACCRQHAASHACCVVKPSASQHQFSSDQQGNGHGRADKLSRDG